MYCVSDVLRDRELILLQCENEEHVINYHKTIKQTAASVSVLTHRISLAYTACIDVDNVFTKGRKWEVIFIMHHLFYYFHFHSNTRKETKKIDKM